MIYTGDCLEILPTLEAESVQCCVTSPPYYGLRDYGVVGQIGMEKTSQDYIDRLVIVFREVGRVLRNDGVLWLNLGDFYSGGEMMGIPWRVAFALQSDGWWLRSEIIWNKPNQMPESVKTRPTKSHEHIFLLAKSVEYFYDCDAIREPHSDDYLTNKRGRQWGDKVRNKAGNGKSAQGDDFESHYHPNGRNRRSVWTITTKPFKEAHFAVFPPEIPEICIKAGSKSGDTILDPFSGAGTTGLVAEKLGRKFIGIELNPSYVEMSKKRIEDDCGGLFADRG
jgi:DNA modification methylase